MEKVFTPDGQTCNYCNEEHPIQILGPMNFLMDRTDCPIVKIARNTGDLPAIASLTHLSEYDFEYLRRHPKRVIHDMFHDVDCRESSTCYWC